MAAANPPEAHSRPFTIGLTGGIGSGKSAAALIFEALGVTVVDTDAIAHELTRAEGAAMAAIRSTFGDNFVTPEGALDRVAMRRCVFNDKNSRKRLEAILHPMIRDESFRALQATASPYAVLAVPLLIESAHFQERCDRIVVVDCPESVQIGRVVARSGMAVEEVQRIISAQTSRKARLAAADDVLDNAGTLEHLREQITALHSRYLDAAREAARRHVL